MEAVTQDEPPRETAPGGSRSLVEIVFATILAVVALAMAWTARGYPAESAAYPIAIAGAVAALAVAIALREIVRRGQGMATAGRFARHPRRLALAAAALVAYFGAVSVAGFALPSLAAALVLPAIGGFRRHGLSLTVGLVCVAAIIVFFVIVLQRPLPPDWLEPLWTRFR